MKSVELNYAGERAYRLAIVNLTRRDDLEVTQSQEDYGLDLVIQILHDGRRTGKVFGVEIKGLLATPNTSSKQNGYWMFPVQYTLYEEAASTPLCMFLFFMQTDQGFYKWLKEPWVNNQGEPELRLNVTGGFKELDAQALDLIVAQVNQWYGAGGVSADIETFVDATEKNPRAILMLLFVTLEREVQTRLQEANLIIDGRYLPLPQAVELGVKAGVFPQNARSSVKDLWRVRNEMLHSGNIDTPLLTILDTISTATDLLRVLTMVDRRKTTLARLRALRSSTMARNQYLSPEEGDALAARFSEDLITDLINERKIEFEPE